MIHGRGCLSQCGTVGFLLSSYFIHAMYILYSGKFSRDKIFMDGSKNVRKFCSVKISCCTVRMPYHILVYT